MSDSVTILFPCYGRNMSPKERGAWAEEQAAQYLQKNKYRIIERNWFCPFGEIDVIARMRKTIVFIEVKYRSSEFWGGPELAVHWAKQQKLLRCAQAYLSYKMDGVHTDARFDVIAVSPHALRHIPGAFDASGCSYDMSM